MSSEPRPSPGGVRALLAGNRYVLDPADPAVEALVAPALTYTARVGLKGRDYAIAQRNNRPTFFEQKRRLYGLDGRGRVAAPAGTLEAVQAELARHGLACPVVDLQPRPDVWTPDWSAFRAFGLSFRYRQREAVDLVLKHRCGRIDCPTAFGKSWIAGILALILPKARVVITTPSLDVIQQRIYPQLCSLLPQVGLRTGSKKTAPARVMCVTTDSLHNVDPDADLVIADECFPAGTLVDGRPIEAIRPGEFVTAFDPGTGELRLRRVLRSGSRPAPSRLYAIEVGGRVVHATAEHPFWTKKGWVNAESVTAGDELLCDVRHAVPGQTQQQPFAGGERVAGLVLERLPGGVVEEAAGVSRLPDLRRDVLGPVSFATGDEHPAGSAGVLREKMRRADGPAEEQRGHLPGDAGEAVRDDETDREAAAGAGRERDRAEPVRAAPGRGDGVAQPLQAGSGRPDDQTGDRGRREHPLRGPEGGGRPQDGVLGWTRVDRVAVHQRPGAGGPCGVCRDGRVYNLEVEGDHTYLADGVVVHNCHQMGADAYVAQLARFTRARMWGFSASHDCRPDGLDARIAALFGPIRLSISYDEAVANGLVTPIEVRWTGYRCPDNPCAGLSRSDTVGRNRLGLWSNDFRNAAIAADCRRHGPNEQVLVTVTTLQHALHLKRFLPEFELVYRADGVTPEDRDLYDRHGLWPAGLAPLDAGRKAQLTQAFEAGRLKKVIATTVWNRGVSFNELAVLARGDGGQSAINDRQVPGRTSRLDDGKELSVVYDYPDTFDPGFAQKACKRSASYQAMGWPQRGAVPAAPKGARR